MPDFWTHVLGGEQISKKVRDQSWQQTAIDKMTSLFEPVSCPTRAKIKGPVMADIY